MIRIRKIVRSALTRFLPGWILALIAFPTFFSPQTLWEIDAALLSRLAQFTAFSLAGHMFALGVLAPRLRADADIVGRKSILAGACSVGALLITSLARHGRWTEAVILVDYAAVGFATTFALYLPWVQSRAAANEDREALRQMADSPYPRIDHVPQRYRDRVL